MRVISASFKERRVTPGAYVRLELAGIARRTKVATQTLEPKVRLADLASFMCFGLVCGLAAD